VRGHGLEKVNEGGGGGARQDYTLEELRIACPTDSYRGARISKNEINVACSTYGRSEKCVKNLTRKSLNRRNY
jgi:hypothetical protein